MNAPLFAQLLVSDATTGTHGTLRWRLRVRGNTAVEFGVVPADHCSRHGTLHKVTRLRLHNQTDPFRSEAGTECGAERFVSA